MSALNNSLLFLVIAFFFIAAVLAIIGTFKYRDGRPLYEWRNPFMYAGLFLVLSVTTAMFFWVIQ